jgi:2-C-methyl-D-erythritol 4-phosphate cytidylyltransferase
MKAEIIVPVAGKGKRFGGEIPKQFYTLANQPILLHTLEKIITSPLIRGGVIVCGEHDIKFLEDLLFPVNGLKDKFNIVTGGKRRQDSVYNGFQSISENTEIVIIHDGVRPFISHDLIERCITSAEKSGACITAIPVSDTIKKVKEGKIVTTIDRKDLFQAQTPQAFKYEILAESFNKAKDKNLHFTDEAALVEWAGYEVYIVQGEKENIKITTQNDLLIAEKILDNRK